MLDDTLSAPAPYDDASCDYSVPGTVAAMSPDDEALFAAAAEVLDPRDVPGTATRLSSKAAAARTHDGRVFVGVSVQMHCGLGFCAEHSAAAAMAAHGPTAVAAVVSVHMDDDGVLEVVPPCGRCREFLRQLDPSNMATRVLLPGGRSTTLERLLPHPW